MLNRDGDAYFADHPTVPTTILAAAAIATTTIIIAEATTNNSIVSVAFCHMSQCCFF